MEDYVCKSNCVPEVVKPIHATPAAVLLTPSDSECSYLRFAMNFDEPGVTRKVRCGITTAFGKSVGRQNFLGSSCAPQFTSWFGVALQSRFVSPSLQPQFDSGHLESGHGRRRAADLPTWVDDRSLVQNLVTILRCVLRMRQ